MLQIPMAFKGPKNLLNQLASLDQIYQASNLLLHGALKKWQHKENIEIITAVITQNNKHYKTSLAWPLNTNKDVDFKENLGSCSCRQSGLCVHLLALLIESKVILHQLPPFTLQLQASNHLADTFENWINKQHFDPYPNMARHRILYLLNSDDEGQTFTIALHKAYLSTEGRYTLKAPLKSNFLDKIKPPKFVSLADLRILTLIQQYKGNDLQQFTLENEQDTILFKEILQTQRCFWKACYRSPLEFVENVALVSRNTWVINQHFYFSRSENTIATKQSKKDQAVSIKIATQDKITPQLTLSSYEVCVQAQSKHYLAFDVAKINFQAGNYLFCFADLSNGTVLPESHLLQQMLGYVRQIENLNSVFAHFEAIVLQDFHLNDRYIDRDFSLIAYLLRGLQKDGWNIIIDDNYYLNRTTASNWYANINQTDAKNHANNTDTFQLELGITINNENINILPYLVKAIESGQWHKSTTQDLDVKLANGKHVALANEHVRHILSVLAELYDAQVLNQKKLKLTTAQLSRINQLQKAFTKNNHKKTALTIHGDSWLKHKAKQLNNSKGLEKTKQPENLAGTLRDYQLFGLSWLQFLGKHQLGGILADDMGLGKTLQILAHLLALKNNKQLKEPCLIIVPTTLLSNWQSEIQKYTPNLSALVLTGSKRSKLYAQIQHYDIIISSYGILARDIVLLEKYNFSVLILDEAQTIKNSRTQTAKAAMQLHAKQRICLSGTPIENHLGELWSLFNFLMPNFLGTQKQFEHIYRIPIERHSDENRQNDLRQRIAPFLLRRTKSQVAKELPEKTEIVQIIQLQHKQKELYETLRISMHKEIQHALATRPENKIIIGNAMLRLRQICCHPALLKLDKHYTNDDSAKLTWLQTVLPTMLAEGRKVLLFSSFTRMLAILEQFLAQQNIKYLTLTGKTPSAKRGALIEKFQQGNVPIFLISLKAGGTGINLTAADTVIHFDPWWNPAAESQASDRAHRIGQNKKVFVYKLISQGTIEQRIMHLQKHKYNLAQSVFNQPSALRQIYQNNQWQELFMPIDKK